MRTPFFLGIFVLVSFFALIVNIGSLGLNLGGVFSTGKYIVLSLFVTLFLVFTQLLILFYLIGLGGWLKRLFEETGEAHFKSVRQQLNKLRHSTSLWGTGAVLILLGALFMAGYEHASGKRLFFHAILLSVAALLNAISLWKHLSALSDTVQTLSEVSQMENNLSSS